ncbi:hypothetical protein [Roseovarius sp.]|uniref:hypothetical protein n=1 Tax=Roseovarius sp. TaxID=1486281 RepID=UPI0026205CEE|nr:hypothetical protein [Roseovarius sp.]
MITTAKSKIYLGNAGYTLVGEIVGDPEIWTNRGPGNLLQGRYVVRRVRWLANVNELELDPKVAVALRTQNALILNAGAIF